MLKQTSPSEPESDADDPNQTAKRPPSSPVRSITIVLLLLGLGLFAYSMVADRLTPYTDQATVQAYVVRVAPDVSGRVTSVNVLDNQIATASVDARKREHETEKEVPYCPFHRMCAGMACPWPAVVCRRADRWPACSGRDSFGFRSRRSSRVGQSTRL
jgi:hypothetical protein